MPSGFRVNLGGPLATSGTSDGTPTGHAPTEGHAYRHGRGESGTQLAATTAGATTLEDRGGWIHHRVRVGDLDRAQGNKLPPMPAAASRAGRVRIPTAADPYTGNAPIIGINFGVEKPIIDPVGVPFSAVHGISVFGEVVTSAKQDGGKGGCGCGGR